MRMPDNETFRENLGSHLILDRKFQFRYTFALIGIILAATLPVVGVCLYYLNNNYSTFIDLAFTHSPDLTSHLNRERAWANVSILTYLVTVLVFCFFFGLRITNRLISPIMVVKEHIKSLSRGHWDAPDIVPNEDDEYYELVEAYYYFYKSLKHLTKTEVDRLRKLQPLLKEKGTNNHELQIWQDLIQEKIKRLGILGPPRA